MIIFFLIILFFEQLALFGWGLVGQSRVYQFPFLATAVFAGFVFIQLLGLYNSNYPVPEGSVNLLMLMSILSLGMIYLGDTHAKKPIRMFSWRYSDQLLVFGSGFLMLLGAFFFYKISRLPTELKGSQWSGVVVAYRFVATSLSYGFALAVLMFFRTHSRLALLIACIGASFYLDRIIFAGRRGDAAEFFFILVLGAWFGWRYLLPKTIMLCFVVVMALALHSTGSYRGMVRQVDSSPFAAIENIEFIENIRTILSEGGTELVNACYQISAIEKTSNYDFGLFHWNTLVFNYVPAQILGTGFKQALIFPLENISIDGYETPTGATATGLVDAFSSFWFFGCLKFYLIAYVLKKIYLKALMGDITAQLFFMIMIGNALHAITHHTHWFLSPWVHMAIFLLPVLLFAKRGSYKINYDQP